MKNIKIKITFICFLFVFITFASVHSLSFYNEARAKFTLQDYEGSVFNTAGVLGTNEVTYNSENEAVSSRYVGDKSNFTTNKLGFEFNFDVGSLEQYATYFYRFKFKIPDNSCLDTSLQFTYQIIVTENGVNRALASGLITGNVSEQMVNEIFFNEFTSGILRFKLFNNGTFLNCDVTLQVLFSEFMFINVSNSYSTVPNADLINDDITFFCGNYFYSNCSSLE